MLVSRVWRRARPYRGRLVVLALTVLVGAALGVAPALIVRRLIDDGVLAGDRGLVVGLALALAGLAVVQSLIVLLGRWCSSWIGEDLGARLRTETYDHLLTMPIGYFVRTPTGDLVSRLGTDVTGATQLFTNTLTVVLSNLASLAFALVAMAWLSWPITVALIVLLPIFVVPAKLFGRRISGLARRQAEMSAELSAAMVERFGVAGAQLAALYGRPDDDRRRLTAPAEALRDLSVRIAVQGRSFVTALGLVSALAGALIYAVGGHWAIDGALSVGTLIALAGLVGRLYGPLSQLAALPVGLVRSLVSFDRVFRLLDQPGEPGPSIDGEPLPPGGSVNFTGVSFGYGDGPTVLHDIDLEIATGQAVAVVGASGAGKSTLAHLIARLYDVDAGVVAVNGVDVRRLDLARLRAGIGYLTQDAYLFHDSIRANLGYADPTASETRLWEVLAAARLDELVAALPDGLDTVVGDGGFRLSGGERQRLAVARVLLKDPPIVVLDEPTAHLDAGTEAELQQAFDLVRRGRTTVIIAHRLVTVSRADQLIVLQAGRIVERGRPADLLAAGGSYAALHRAQHTRRSDGVPTAR